MKFEQGKSNNHLSIPRGIVFALSFGVILVLFFSMNGVAQRQEQRKPKNLQVLDSTISHDELIGLMNKFTVALGVECDHCHAARGKEGDLDFASDENKTKLTARAMLKMVNTINGAYISKLASSDEPRVTVECVTCHRGQPRPILLQDLLMRTRKEHGMAAVDSVYRDLRKDYYGSHTYDFTDHTLMQLGLEVAKESGSDAISILKLNKEFNPQSAPNEWALGRVYEQLGDTASAVTQYKRALELNPSFRRAQRDLEMLGAGKKQ